MGVPVTKQTHVKMPPNLSISTGFGLFERETCLQLMNMLRIVMLTLICISICCPFAGDSYQEPKPGNELCKSEASGSYRVTKHRRNRPIHGLKESRL